MKLDELVGDELMIEAKRLQEENIAWIQRYANGVEPASHPLDDDISYAINYINEVIDKNPNMNNTNRSQLMHYVLSNVRASRQSGLPWEEQYEESRQTTNT